MPHDALHTDTNRIVASLETKLGTGASVAASGQFLVGSSAGVTGYRAATKSDVGLSNADNTSDATKLAAAITAALAAVYPVGCLYFETTNTNPATTFSFGTWTAFGSGKVPVGYASGDPDFGTGGATGGSKTTNIAHTHTIDHTHNLVDTTPGGVNLTIPAPFFSGPSGAMSANATPSVLQPFIVVFIWKRTA